jgi:Protein of unknown function (DUF4031)
MTAYIDTATEWPSAGFASSGAGRGNVWAHLAADTLEELHAFAKRLGLRRRDFNDGDHPHYRLSLSMWGDAQRMGAQQVTRRDLLIRAGHCVGWPDRQQRAGGI